LAISVINRTPDFNYIYVKKLLSLYRLQCKGDIVVVDIKKQKSQFNNLNFTITQSAKLRKGREGKERHKKSRKRYVSPIRGEAPRKRIFTKFCISGDMPDIIICANFGVEK